MNDRKKLRTYHIDTTSFDPEEVKPCLTLLATFMLRVKRFGDIFNGYSPE